MKHILFFSLFLALLLLTGCNKNVGLSGKVVFSDDKSPVPLGTVGLESVSGVHAARGDIKQDGTFSVGSVKSNDGLPPGKYRVSVTAWKQTAENPETGEGIFESLIDVKHGNPETSELTLDITSTTRNFVIEVDRPAPSASRRR